MLTDVMLKGTRGGSRTAEGGCATQLQIPLPLRGIGMT